MSLDVKNIAGLNTGNSQNGRVTVKGNRNDHQQQAAAAGPVEYDLEDFDNVGPVMKDRFDDPRYYQGDADA